MFVERQTDCGRWLEYIVRDADGNERISFATREAAPDYWLDAYWDDGDVEDKYYRIWKDEPDRKVWRDDSGRLCFGTETAFVRSVAAPYRDKWGTAIDVGPYVYHSKDGHGAPVRVYSAHTKSRLLGAYVPSDSYAASGNGYDEGYGVFFERAWGTPDIKAFLDAFGGNVAQTEVTADGLTVVVWTCHDDAYQDANEYIQRWLEEHD
jgi:hypothetical protein